MGKFYEGVYEDLTLYVKTAAWWSAAPSDGKAERKSRVAARQELDKRFEPPMPPVDDEFEYLLSALFEAGPTSTDGMGRGALKWSDLMAWQQATGIELRPWELRIVRRLSGDYLAELVAAEKPSRLCPYAGKAELAATAQALRKSMQGLANL